MCAISGTQKPQLSGTISLALPQHQRALNVWRTLKCTTVQCIHPGNIQFDLSNRARATVRMAQGGFTFEPRSS